MASLEQLIEEYMDTAVGPEDMQQLALLQLANASVQDDAVGRAAQNLQGVEKANRSALESYLIAQDEAAQAEANKAVEYASKRLSEITNALTMFGTVSGLSQSQKAEMEALKAEKEKILKAFPQLGFASDGVSVLSNDDDYSDIVGSNDKELWTKFAKNANIDEIAKLYDDKLGQIPQELEAMLTYRMRQSPELTAKLKTDAKYRPIAHLAGETLGDAINAAANAKKNKKQVKDINWAKDILKPFASLGDRKGLQGYAARHPELKEAVQILQDNDMIGDYKDKLKIAGLI